MIENQYWTVEKYNEKHICATCDEVAKIVGVSPITIKRKYKTEFLGDKYIVRFWKKTYTIVKDGKVVIDNLSSHEKIAKRLHYSRSFVTKCLSQGNMIDDYEVYETFSE